MADAFSSPGFMLSGTMGRSLGGPRFGSQRFHAPEEPTEESTLPPQPVFSDVEPPLNEQGGAQEYIMPMASEQAEVDWDTEAHLPDDFGPAGQSYEPLGAAPCRWIACGAFHTACVTASGSVYAWGSNGYGQCGHGDGARAACREPRWVAMPGDERATQVSCGRLHSAVVLASGQVATWGYARAFLGHGDFRVPEHAPNLPSPRILHLPAGVKALQVSCGDQHSAVVTDDGQLFVWGCGAGGRLGLGDESDQPTPVRVRSIAGTHVTQVACGARHTLLLDDAGAVMACGAGPATGLGAKAAAPDAAAACVPCPVQGAVVGQKCIALAAGARHSLVLTQHSAVFAAGENAHGQLGVGDRETRATFTHVPLAGPEATAEGKQFRRLGAVSIAAGAYHSAAVTHAGDPVTWGAAGPSREAAPSPEALAKARPTDILDREVQREQGKAHGSKDDDFDGLLRPQSPDMPAEAKRDGYGILNFITEADARELAGVEVGPNGEALRLGYNSLGHLRQEGAGDRLLPMLLQGGWMADGRHFAWVAAGGYHTAATTLSGDVFTWGSGGGGRLGHGHEKAAVTPTLVGPLAGRLPRPQHVLYAASVRRADTVLAVRVARKRSTWDVGAAKAAFADWKGKVVPWGDGTGDGDDGGLLGILPRRGVSSFVVRSQTKAPGRDKLTEAVRAQSRPRK
ncbi:unnamed protein product [Pedinophyceae sp. YPF-701]|nr:unnamed protein product [Pedinophyceae sp. YPF-701]